MKVSTPKNNKANVTYSYEGIPMDKAGLMPLYVAYHKNGNIIIQPHLKNDKGLLLHELTHVDQYNEYCFYNTRYKFSKSFRFKMESEAFASQLKGDGDLEKLQTYANELSTKYNISKSVEECKKNIMKFYKEQENA